MWGYHLALWRRKRIRCVIASCLGISALISVVLVIGGTNGSSRLLAADGDNPHLSSDYYVNYGGVHSKLPVADRALRGHHVTDNNLSDKSRDQRNSRLKVRSEQTKRDSEEYGYYGDDKPLNHGPQVDNGMPPAAKNAYGFVIEDNAADYVSDYDDEEDAEEYDDNNDEDYANPPFKTGDFDYNLLNKTQQQAFRLKFQPGDYENRSQEHHKVNNNDTHSYGGVQHKSMHLLETQPHKVNGGFRNQSLLKTQKLPGKYAKKPQPQKQRVIYREGDRRQSVVVSNKNKPCMGGPDCQNSPGGVVDKSVNSHQDVDYINHNQDRIETQIPIQDGGFDTNWILQEQPATQIQMPELPWQPGEVRFSPGGIPLVVDRIYWSKEVEDLIATGITDKEFQNFLHKLYTTPVREMQAPQWNKCGRPLNQYIVLQDGTPLCARFREEHVKLLHGEILSYYFARILGLDNVPIVVLSEARSDAPQWRGMNLSAAGWNESSIVALIQWIDGLDNERSRVKMPSVILQAYENGSVFDHNHPTLHHLNGNDLTELLQWSDLILFDYLNGHYDRVASMQDGADREQKPSIMHENIRNLRKVWQTGKVWLIDNESGFFDGYELLYQGGEMGRKFVQFHIQMLKANCIFRRQTVTKIFQLASYSSPYEALLQYAGEQDPLYQHLPYTKEMTLFKKYFPVRLKEVTDWIKKCQNR